MPLQSGSSQETISANIATERRAHPSMDPKQAAAIAYSKARGDDALEERERDEDVRFAALDEKFDDLIAAVAKTGGRVGALASRMDALDAGWVGGTGWK